MYTTFEDGILTKALNIAECFKMSTGINCLALSNNSADNDVDFCHNPFCLQLQSITGQQISCNRINDYAAHKSDDLGGQYIYMCPNGLCHFVAPIKEENRVCGMLLAGPVLISDIDDYLTELKETHNIDDETIQMLEKYISNISVASREK